MTATDRIASALPKFLAWGPDFVGSTRPAALMRIGIALIIFARFGAEVSLFNATSSSGVALGLAFFMVATMMLVGYMSRLASAMTGLALLGMYFIGGAALAVPGWAHHHVYLLAIASILLALTPCGASYSVDRLRELGHGGAPPERGYLWGQRLIALQLSALYFWTAVDKTDWAFLSGQRLEQIFVWTYTGRALELFLIWPPLLALLSIIVVAVEYWLAVAILVPRWRRFALPVGIGLHGTFYLLLPVDTYSITAITLYLALLDPDAVHRFIDRIQGHGVAAHRL